MKSEDFVNTTRQVVYESAVKNTLSLIQKPPGRSPPESLAGLSRWFAQLPDADKRNLETRATAQAELVCNILISMVGGVNGWREWPRQIGWPFACVLDCFSRIWMARPP